MALAVGHQTYIGVAKETTPGTFAAPTSFPGYANFGLAGKNNSVARPNGRQRYGVSLSPPAGFDISGNIDPNPDPDTLLPWIAWAMGAQTTPIGAIYALGITTGATTSGSNTVFTIGGSASSFVVGQSLVVEVSGANQETCTITAVSGSTITVSSTTKNHASGVYVFSRSTTAFVSQLSYGLTLPALSVQFNRGSDAVDYVYTTIDSMKLGLKPNGLLSASFGCVAQSVLIDASPATPSYSVALPFNAETAVPSPVGTQVVTGGGLFNIVNAVTVNGAALSAGTICKEWSLSLANNVDKNFRQVNSRLVAGFPLGQRKTTAQVKFSFADSSLFKLFLGSSSATSPGSTIGGVAITLPVASVTLADATRSVPYLLCAVLPNCFPTDDPVPGVQYGSLEQTFSLEAAETPGGNNDLQFVIISASAAAY
jgi:hypothetical protein